MGDDDKHNYMDFGEILKSPLDTNKYKLIRLCPNKMTAFLVSTLDQIDDPKTKIKKPKLNCAVADVLEFNSKYLNIPNIPVIIHGEIKNQADEGSKGQQDNKNSKLPKSKPMEMIGRSLTGCRKGVIEDLGEDINKLFVCLSVGSGLMHDEVRIPGVAHFVEHCISLGSKKFPQPESLQTFLQENYGDTNAGTNPEGSFFYFDVDVENKGAVETSLDMFFDGFSNTTFDREMMKKELASLDSEYNSKKLDDELRYIGLIQSLAIEGHPIGKFGFGCSETIPLDEKDVKEKIIAWKDKHYVTDNMVLSIMGPFSMQYLVDLAVKYGNTLKTCSCGLSPWKGIYEAREESLQPLYPFELCQWNRMYFVEPVLNTKLIRLAWVLPPEAAQAYKTKVHQFLTYLLSSKAKGSLESYLKKQEWLIEICCVCPVAKMLTTKFCTIFTLGLNLTEKGFQNRIKVYLAVFSYLKMLYTASNSNIEELERVFDELKQIHADTFHYRKDTNLVNPINDFSLLDEPMDDVPSVLRSINEVILNEVPPAETLLANLVTTEYNPQLISKCLSLMTPKRANFVIESKAFEMDFFSTEKWYNTKYSSTVVNKCLIEMLEKVTIYPDFHLPHHNPFIDRGLCHTFETHKQFELTSDFIFLNDSKAYVSYVDYDFGKGHFPTATYEMMISSPKLADVTRCKVIPGIDVWKAALQYLLDIKLAEAVSSLYSYNLDFDYDNLICTLSGPSTRLPELFKIIIQTIMNLEKELREETFETLVETQILSYSNLLLDSENLANQLKDNLLHQAYYMQATLIHCLKEISFDEFVDFVETINNTMFIKVELNGCVTKKQAESVSETVSGMKYRPWTDTCDGIRQNRAIVLPIGERCLTVKTNNVHDTNNIIINHYQFGTLDQDEIEILDLLAISLNSICYQTLRSNEQLCYFCEVINENYLSVFGITIIVNAEARKFTSDYINERIDTFLLFYFNEIVGKKYSSKFKEHTKDLEGKFDNWAKMKQLYQMHLLPSGSAFKKISVQVNGYRKSLPKPKLGSLLSSKMKKYSSGIPMSKTGASDEIEKACKLDYPKNVKEENGYYITRVSQFKNNLFCYPNTE